MDKKRSKGVIFWGWVFIILGVFGLVPLLNFKHQIQVNGLGQTIFNIAMAVASVACGIFILKLNDAARKVAICLSIISVILFPFYTKQALRIAKSESYAQYLMAKDKIIKEVKPEYQKSMLIDLETKKDATDKAMPFAMVILLGPFFLLEALQIYFFTRPKVKEQFRRE